MNVADGRKMLVYIKVDSGIIQLPVIWVNKNVLCLNFDKEV